MRFHALIVTGGSPAVSLLQSLSVDLLRFEEYIERVTGGELDSFVIKPGGLCSESVLSTSISVLRDPQLSSKPVVALTMGDPCGIGPEIIVKALALPRVSNWCRILVLGDPDSLKKAATFCTGLSEITIVVAETYEKDGKKWRRLNWPENKSSVLVWNPLQVEGETTFTLGEVMPEAGRFAAEWVIFAVQLAMAGVVDAIVTAPLNKEAMNLGGYKFAGHTELLAKYSGAKTSRLMLASGNFKVVHATGHCSYKDVPKKLTKERIIETIELSRDFFVASDVADPKIAVAGLNPHAGDGGLFGDEEPRVIEPAVAECRAKGWNVTGPFPADTLFGKVVRGDYDVVFLAGGYVSRSGSHSG
ncbi:4-hydroxythreonine-4-phosphate dehydrogenase-like isoform X2 [Oscarella lobularis]|uniref:4-hydroxythreonine-4-phosphate dehydrogenase-like isoform X2 n=1 Tax=Oscarella lobularis TaxID=121494 RepID=UPI003313ED20